MTHVLKVLDAINMVLQIMAKTTSSIYTRLPTCENDHKKIA